MLWYCLVLKWASIQELPSHCRSAASWSSTSLGRCEMRYGWRFSFLRFWTRSLICSGVRSLKSVGQMDLWDCFAVVSSSGCSQPSRRNFLFTGCLKRSDWVINSWCSFASWRKYSGCSRCWERKWKSIFLSSSLLKFSLNKFLMRAR